MIFEWPIVLWLLLVVPILIAGYRIVLERKEMAAASFARWTTNTGTTAVRWKQSLPPTLFLIAVVALITGMARPVAVISLPSLQDSVILAIDVSNSMMADDLQPTRLAAAQQAAKAFIDEQPLTTKIGVVAFAETALLIQRPTDNRDDLMKAVERLKAQDGTAVGGAILVGLQALFPKETFDVVQPAPEDDKSIDDRDMKPAPAERAKQAPGSESSSAIVLLTDGQTTSGPDPVKAAQVAADRGVRIYTIGLGTDKGAVVKVEGVSMRVQPDLETLKKVADTTLGRTFLAADTKDLTEVYRTLNSRLITEVKETEITAGFIALAALALLFSTALSLLWFNRIL
jgi:Ca-activated chloride channel homolog